MTESRVQAKAQEQEVTARTPADIVLAIPTYDNASTIEQVVHAAQACLEKYYGSQKSVILHCDGGSKDGTLERALAADLPEGTLLQVTYPVYSVHRLSSSYEGIPGKINAIRTIFLKAKELGAKACAVLDAGLSTITSEWVHALVDPIFDQDFDFVSPCYVRQRYEGAITGGIAYPLMRALYGKRVRYPVGGDLGFSSRLIDFLLERDVGESEAMRSGVDIWLTIQALCGGFKLCQAWLGPRDHPPSYQAPELSNTLAQVLGTLYTEMERKAPVWQRIRGSVSVPTFGLRVLGEAGAPDPNVTPMLSSFQRGLDTLNEIWGQVLSPATMLALKRLARNGEDGFRFPDELWARIVYDFSLGHRLRAVGRDQLLRAITPLYLGWLASLVLETREATSAAVEERIEKLSQTYETQKPYLVSRWRWPDRFMP